MSIQDLSKLPTRFKVEYHCSLTCLWTQLSYARGVQLDGGASLSIGSAARESPPFHTAKILVVRRGSWVAGTAGHWQGLHEE